MNRCGTFLKALPGNASLIHRPENIRWLTGYTGEGCAFIANAAQVIITDFRYVEQAQRQAPECECLRTGQGVTEAAVVKALCDRYNIRKLSVETDYITHDAYAELNDALTAVELMPLKQLPQQLRMIKDADEIDCIRRAADDLLPGVRPRCWGTEARHDGEAGADPAGLRDARTGQRGAGV